MICRQIEIGWVSFLSTSDLSGTWPVEVMFTYYFVHSIFFYFATLQKLFFWFGLDSGPSAFAFPTPCFRPMSTFHIGLCSFHIYLSVPPFILTYFYYFVLFNFIISFYLILFKILPLGQKSWNNSCLIFWMLFNFNIFYFHF